MPLLQCFLVLGFWWCYTTVYSYNRSLGQILQSRQEKSQESHNTKTVRAPHFWLLMKLVGLLFWGWQKEVMNSGVNSLLTLLQLQICNVSLQMMHLHSEISRVSHPEKWWWCGIHNVSQTFRTCVQMSRDGFFIPSFIGTVSSICLSACMCLWMISKTRIWQSVWMCSYVPLWIWLPDVQIAPGPQSCAQNVTSSRDFLHRNNLLMRRVQRVWP